ncbi:MAG: hypothetical protein R2716_06335 [Microthrixaceae bacterium]
MPAETHVQQGPVSEILRLVQDRLGDILEIDPEQVSEGDSFTQRTCMPIPSHSSSWSRALRGGAG